jgi:ornithine carbamoyltransferase
MYTFALFCYSSSSASKSARARGKGEKKRNEEKKDDEEEEEEYLRGRRVAMIYENRSIETRLLYVVMLLMG